jgi:hypothetical protein
MHCLHGLVSSQKVPYFLQLSHLPEYEMRPGLADLSLGGSRSLLLALVDVADVGAAENPEVDSRSASLFLALAALSDVVAVEIPEADFPA